MFHQTSGITPEPLLSSSAIITASVLGLIVPIIASFGPIRQALRSNLRDSLDRRHSKVKAVIITIERSGASVKDLGVPTLIGLLFTVFGFAIYYFLPMALVNNQLALLFNIFFALILGMLFGLVLLSVNVQPLAERLVLFIMFFLTARFENTAMQSLVRKNLTAHKLRNRKTSTMLSFSLSFIIFLGMLIVRVQNPCDQHGFNYTKN